MTLPTNIRLSVVAFATIISTSILIWFGSGLNPWWPLLWIAPLPVLLFTVRSSWRSTAIVTTISWLTGSLNMGHYFSAVLHIPLAILALIIVIPALAFAAAVLLFRALLRKGAIWSALLAFPAAWVSYEYLVNLFSPHGTAGSISYSQLKFLPVLQLASVTGPWGISFLVLLFSSSLALGLHLRQTAPRQALRIVAAGSGVVVLTLIFGAARLALPLPRQQVKVGLIASDLPGNVDIADEGAATARLFHDYAGKVEELAAGGAEVIVLPEKLGVAVDSDQADAGAIFQSLANKAKSRIVVGLLHVSPQAKYNEARMYSPEAPEFRYDKHHMLPLYESMLKPGTTLTLLSASSGTWGVAICKDMDFTPLSRLYGKAGAGLMLAPAWDFDLDRLWHGHMAVMRGVESGFSVVRAARQGYLTVSDDRGRILAEARSDSADFATLVADVPAAHDATLYLLLGDWFAWLALMLLVFSLVQLYRPRNSLGAQEIAVPSHR
jgi:apolipoprotein N-acyltransferase